MKDKDIHDIIARCAPTAEEVEEMFQQNIHSHVPAADSMTYWWPKLEKLPVKTPKTIMTPVNYGEALENVETKLVPSGELLKKAANTMGYPLFLRTDLASFKQEWNETCFVKSANSLESHANLLNYYTFFFGIDSIDAFFVRELIPLKQAGFDAFDGKMPITKEIRCFIRNGGKECQHPYWMNEAFEEEEMRISERKENGIETTSSLPADWTERLTRCNVLTSSDQKEIDNIVNIVAKEFYGFWSVDLAQHENNDWYVLDMATGEESFHYPHEGKATFR